MPKLMALNGTPIVLSDDSDDERVSEGWFPEMEASRAYKDAVLVFTTQKYCKHQGKALDLAAMQTILASFIGEPAVDHFSGRIKNKFCDLKSKFVSTYSTVASSRSKKWPRPYVANMLAGLVLLSREQKEATRPLFMNKNTTPSTKKRAKSIRQRCIDDDEDIKTGIEDMEPADSQEAYNYADMIVADADE